MRPNPFSGVIASLGLLILWTFVLAGPLEGAQGVKVSDLLVTGGNVKGFSLAAGGARVVYSADQDTDGIVQLYSTFADRWAPSVRLHAPLSTGRNVLEFALSPDGMRAVYRADADRNDVFELYSVPVDGRSAPVKLNGSPVQGGDVDAVFPISPDGQRVVYLADQDVDGVHALYGVPIDGSSPAVKLSGPHVPVSSSLPREQHRLSGDGARVVFRTNAAELYSAPIDGSAPAVRLSGAETAGFFAPGPGDRAVYTAPSGLWSVTVDGSSSAVQITPLALNSNGFFLFSPDGTRVVYQAATSLLNQLYSAAVDGSSAPTPIGGETFTNRFFRSWTISPDSAFVVYIVNKEGQSESGLYSVRIDGSVAPIELSAGLGVGVNAAVPALISPAGNRVVFSGGPDSFLNQRLYVAPIDGSVPPTQLSPEGVFGVAVPSQLVAVGRDVVFLIGEQCFHAPVDASVGADPINPPRPGSSVTRFVADGDRVLYRADQDVGGVFELYASFRTRPHRSR